MTIIYLIVFLFNLIRILFELWIYRIAIFTQLFYKQVLYKLISFILIHIIFFCLLCLLLYCFSSSFLPHSLDFFFVPNSRISSSLLILKFIINSHCTSFSSFLSIFSMSLVSLLTSPCRSLHHPSIFSLITLIYSSNFSA